MFDLKQVQWRLHPPTTAGYCQTSQMKNLIATICLTIALLLGSARVSWSQDYHKGYAAAQSGNFATALREWTPLAKQGNVNAQYNLGVMYENGQGVPKNYKTAVKWYRLAAEQGNAAVQYILGQMYRQGRGVSQDYKTAVKWYKLAAEQGSAFAQYNLGMMYSKGQGVSQDYRTAVKWYTLAAEQGDADAQGNLGVMYAFGTGVLKDYVYAHMWGNMAVSIGGKDKGKVRDFVAKQMTPPQLKTAQDLAHKCVHTNYKGC